MTDKRQIAPREAKVIDWSKVRHRMEISRSAVERGAVPSLEEKKRVLRARAKELAQDVSDKKAIGETIEVLEFLLATESYGIEMSFVREVGPMKELTPLAGTPPFILGITSVRGQILSIIDIRRFLNMPEIRLSENPKIIIVSNKSMEFGILADNISGVRSIPIIELQSSLPALLGSSIEYLRGVTNERMVILDAAKMFSDKNFVIDEKHEI